MLKSFANGTDTNKDAQNDLGASDTQLGSTNIMMKNQNSTKEKNKLLRDMEERNRIVIQLALKVYQDLVGKGKKTFFWLLEDRSLNSLVIFSNHHPQLISAQLIFKSK